MKTKYFIPLLLLTITSCNKIDDLYDSSKLQEEAKENFPVKGIDPNQDWDMTTVKTISVTVDNTENDVYTFKVYTENPFNSDSNAKLMCIKENVKNGSTFDLVFDAPKVYTTAYLLLVDSKGMEYLKTFDVTEDKTSFTWSDKVTTSRSASRYVTRAANAIQGPSDSDFPTNIPDNCTDYNAWVADNKTNNYILSDAAATFYYNDKVIDNLYIKGNSTLEISGTVDRYNLYVLPNATLTLNGSLTSSNIVIYVCNGAKLISNGTIHSGGKIYNRGTIDFKNQNLASYNGLLVYNEGTINNIKELNLTNTASLYNSGIINAENFEMNSSSVLYNECIGNNYDNSGVIKISGTTKLLNGTISFTNNHNFETYSLVCESNVTIDNNCYLKIKNNASFDGTTINMGTKSYIKADSISMNGTTVNLYDKAWINSNSIFYKWGNTIDGKGTTSLVYSKKSTAGSGLCVTYKGNLYVATDSHFKNSDQATFKNDATVNNISYSSVHVSNPINKICDTYDFGTPSTPTQDTPQYYTYAFEDMLKVVGDYDFNDVVIKVSTVPVNNKLTVKLVAAGASKNLYLYYKTSQNDNAKSLFDGREVHDIFEVEKGQMVNTGGTTANEVDCQIDVPVNFTVKDNLDIFISDNPNSSLINSIHIPIFTSGFKNGDVPYAILVPCDWKWPSECQCITDKYSAFDAWAQNALTETEWYK